MYNFHPGSSCGEGSREACVARIVDSINLAHARVPDVCTVVENMAGSLLLCASVGVYRCLWLCLGFGVTHPHAKKCKARKHTAQYTHMQFTRLTLGTAGQGHTIGGRFEELQAIVLGVKDKKRIGYENVHAFIVPAFVL